MAPAAASFSGGQFLDSSDVKSQQLTLMGAYAFGVTYIKSLLRPMFTTSPGCFLLVDL